MTVRTQRGLRTVRPILVIAAALTLLSFGPTAAAQDRATLPDSVLPDHYRITITPNASALTFQGQVDIDVTVRRPTRYIVLNAADIVIDKAALSGEGRRRRSAAIPRSRPPLRLRPSARARTAHPGPELPWHNLSAGFWLLRPRLRHAPAARSAPCSPSSRTPTRGASCPAGTSRRARRPSQLTVIVAARRDGPLQHAGRPDRRADRRRADSASASATRRRCLPTCFSSALGDFERVHRTWRRRRGRRGQARRHRQRRLRPRRRRAHPALLQRLFRRALSRCPSSI